MSDGGLIETWAQVHQNVPGCPKLIVMREWRTASAHVRDLFASVAERHAEAVSADVAALLAWCELPSSVPVELAMSEHASFTKAHTFTRGVAKLRGVLSAECQAALDTKLAAEGGGLRGTLERALA